MLLDELAGGTDPREGEALAAGLLDSFCARGGAVAATTHYEGLKTLALADERFINASVGFDLATMAPTFALTLGIPGSSSALAVARRFGMPSTVLERAERFLTREDRTFELVVKRLEDERAALELARAAAERRERDAEDVRARLDAELTAMKGRERRALSDEAGELMSRLHRARDELRAAQAKLHAKKPEPGAVGEAERAIERVAQEVALGGRLEPLVVKADDVPRGPVPAGELRRGTRVWVPRLRAEAQIIDVLAAGQVRVAAGPLKLTLAASDLRTATSQEPTPSRLSTRGAPSASRAPTDERPLQTRDNTCDLRGLRVDDAVAMATAFLDRALGDAERAVFLLHGHGTGALREALRKELARSSYVARFQAGEANSGGEGVTIVWLS